MRLLFDADEVLTTWMTVFLCVNFLQIFFAVGWMEMSRWDEKKIIFKNLEGVSSRILDQTKQYHYSQYRVGDVFLSNAALRRGSSEKVLWKYAANLQQNTHTEVWFHTSAWTPMFLNLLHIFKTFFYRNTSGGLLLSYTHVLCKLKKNFVAPFYGWGSTSWRLYNHFEEAVYFLPLSSQKFLVLISSTSVVLNMGPVNSESSALTTWPFLYGCRLQLLYYIAVLKGFSKFTGKQLYWSFFFNSNACWRLSFLSKKSLRHSCFPVNFANI